MFENLTRLACDWWQGDRIRVSPKEGNLLTIELPAILQIGAERFEVLARRVYTEDEQVLCYDCQGAQGLGCLVVTFNPRGQLAIAWIDERGPRCLTEADVEVYLLRKPR